MQETNFSSLSTIQKQIIQIQKEVQDLNKKNEFELLRDEFGGELLNNNTVLKINKVCSIEYIDNVFKLTSMIYGMKHEIFGDRNKIVDILTSNL